jgi:hypothetical protein
MRGLHQGHTSHSANNSSQCQSRPLWHRTARAWIHSGFRGKLSGRLCTSDIRAPVLWSPRLRPPLNTGVYFLPRARIERHAASQRRAHLCVPLPEAVPNTQRRTLLRALKSALVCDKAHPVAKSLPSVPACDARTCTSRQLHVRRTSACVGGCGRVPSGVDREVVPGKERLVEHTHSRAHRRFLHTASLGVTPCALTLLRATRR